MRQKQCLECQIQFGENLDNRDFNKAKFCCHSCAAKHNNKIRGYSINHCGCGQIITKHRTKCDQCKYNKVISRLNKYLSNEILIGSHDLKLLLIKLNIKEHKCECCQNTQWLDELISIELHHIDGNPNNNNLDNLQILCPNCHSKTDTYKNKNNLKKILIKNCLQCNSVLVRNKHERIQHFNNRKYCNIDCCNLHKN